MAPREGTRRYGNLSTRPNSRGRPRRRPVGSPFLRARILPRSQATPCPLLASQAGDSYTGRNGFARPRTRRVFLVFSGACSRPFILAAASYQKQAHPQLPALFAFSAGARLSRFAEK